MGMHLCGGKVNDISFLSEADGCGHNKMPPCHRKMMSGCCANETLSYAGQGFAVDQTQIHLSDITYIAVFQPAVFIAEIISPYTSTQKSLQYYDPPLWSLDHIITHQVFRI